MSPRCRRRSTAKSARGSQIPVDSCDRPRQHARNPEKANTMPASHDPETVPPSASTRRAAPAPARRGRIGIPAPQL